MKSEKLSRKRLFKAFFSLLIFYLSFFTCKAQTFKAGFYLGAAITDVDGADNYDNDNDFYHTGFTIAGTLSAKISHKTNLQLEIRFIQKGTSQPPVVDSLPNSATNLPGNAPSNYNIQYNNYYNLTLNYVDIVLGIRHQIQFGVRNRNIDRYGIEAGASAGTLAGYSYEAQSISYPLNLNKLDISPYIGVYYNVTPHFYIEGRYSNSVTSVIKHETTNTEYFANLWYNTWNEGHNLALTLTLGFQFGGSANK